MLSSQGHVDKSIRSMNYFFYYFLKFPLWRFGHHVFLFRQVVTLKVFISSAVIITFGKHLFTFVWSPRRRAGVWHNLYIHFFLWQVSV